jgi:hypothetical protein
MSLNQVVRGTGFSLGSATGGVVLAAGAETELTAALADTSGQSTASR